MFFAIDETNISLNLKQFLLVVEFSGSWVFSEFMFESRIVILGFGEKGNCFVFQWGKLMPCSGDSAVCEQS